MGMVYAKLRRTPRIAPLDECAICLEPMLHLYDVVKPQCGHRFHLDCLVEARKCQNLCPLCRGAIGVVTWAQPRAPSRPVLRHAKTKRHQ